MEAGALVDVADATLPERRSLKDCEIGAVRNVRDHVVETGDHRIGRSEQLSPRCRGLMKNRGRATAQRFAERVVVLTVAIPQLRHGGSETVRYPELSSLATEDEAFACRAV